MELLPLFLKLAGLRVVLVGAGPVAAGKLDALVRAGADVRMVAPDRFQPEDLDGAWLVVSAASGAINRQVAEAAAARRIFVNAVDDPPNASAYLGGVVRRPGVTIAISTSGEAPALAGVLREGIDALLPEDLDRWTACARDLRQAWRADGVPMEQRRPQLIDALKALYP
jgi:uroporphyrin-III C-methyltransferase / precorrin-2 dehydrogenase / sirohydrochlorin ferrochelatase